MFQVSWFLAWRYLWGNKNSSIKTMLIICFIGTFIATCTLALVLSIMEGFEKMTHATLKGMHSDIIMQAHNHNINFSLVKHIIDQEFPAISAISPSDIQHALIKNNSENEFPQVVVIKGVDPYYEAQTSSLATMVCASKEPLTSLLGDDKILIGNKLAQQLHYIPGNTLELLIPSNEQSKKNTINLESYILSIGGTFKTGIEEFDSNFIICSLKTLAKIIPDSGITAIHINHNHKINEQQLITRLQKRFGLNVYSWKDLYPALVSALAMEKYGMMLILSLMVIIASMSIISLQFMIITAKQQDQAILQAMGLPKKYCTFIFIFIGLIVSACASISGLISAFILGSLLQKYPIITLPEAYYVSQLPIIMSPFMFAILCLFSLLLSVFATTFSFLKNKKLTISESLRNI